MDGFGGFFSAFMAAKDVGKKKGQGGPEGFQGPKGSPGEGGGITPEYEQYLQENNLHVNPDGSEGFGRDNRMTGDPDAYPSPGQPQQQQGGWGRGRGFGK